MVARDRCVIRIITIITAITAILHHVRRQLLFKQKYSTFDFQKYFMNLLGWALAPSRVNAPQFKYPCFKLFFLVKQFGN